MLVGARASPLLVGDRRQQQPDGDHEPAEEGRGRDPERQDTVPGEQSAVEAVHGETRREEHDRPQVQVPVPPREDPPVLALDEGADADRQVLHHHQARRANQGQPTHVVELRKVRGCALVGPEGGERPEQSGHRDDHDAEPTGDHLDQGQRCDPTLRPPHLQAQDHNEGHQERRTDQHQDHAGANSVLIIAEGLRDQLGAVAR
jgi:hypothetical protein